MKTLIQILEVVLPVLGVVVACAVVLYVLIRLTQLEVNVNIFKNALKLTLDFLHGLLIVCIIAFWVAVAAGLGLNYVDMLCH